MPSIISIDTTKGMEAGMLICSVEDNVTYMVMKIVNDTDMSVMEYDAEVLH